MYSKLLKLLATLFLLLPFHAYSDEDLETLEQMELLTFLSNERTVEHLSTFLKLRILKNHYSGIDMIFHWPDANLPFPSEAIAIYESVAGDIVFSDSTIRMNDLTCHWKFMPIAEEYWADQEVKVAFFPIVYSSGEEGYLKMRYIMNMNIAEITALSFGHYDCEKFKGIYKMLIPKLESTYPNGYF